MSLLTRSAPPQPTGDVAPSPLASPLAVGGLAAAQALVGSLLCVVAPVIAVWIASTRTDATWSETLRVAADAWLLAHHTGIAVDGGHVALTPLGLTLLPAAWCWAGGRRMAAALATGTPPALGARRRALVAFTAVYALSAAVVSLLAASPVARPLSGQALLGGAVLAAVAAGAAMAGGAGEDRRGPRRAALARLAARLPLPPVLRRVLPAAAVAVTAWLAAGAAVLVVALLAGWDGVVAAHAALGPGPVGGLGLALAQLALVPVAVVWAASWLTGPGFAVGAGTAVTPWFSDLHALPALPLLGALPAGTFPTPVQAVLAVPVLTGVLAGLWLRRRPTSPQHRGGPWWRRPVVDGPACGAAAGLATAALAWLASGPAGPGRMAVVGPEPWLVGLVVAVEVAVGCAATLALPARRAGQPSPGTLVSRLRSSIQRS